MVAARRRLATLPLSLMTLAAAASVCSCTGGMRWPWPTAATSQLVSIEMTGGFAGVDNHLVVDEQGNATLTQRRGPPIRATLSQNALTQLREALRVADFGTLGSRYVNPGSADAFIYTLGHAGHSVTTEDGAIPSQLQRAIGQLVALITRLQTGGPSTPNTTLPQAGTDLTFSGPLSGTMNKPDWVLCHKVSAEARPTTMECETKGVVAGKPWAFNISFPINDYHAAGAYRSRVLQGSVSGVRATLKELDGFLVYRVALPTDLVRVTIAGNQLLVDAVLSSPTPGGGSGSPGAEAVAGTITCASLPT